MTTEIKKISIEQIQTGKYQTRTDDEIDEDIVNLTDSIRNNGLLQPIGVEKIENNKFELVFGSRRLKAVKRLNETEIMTTVYIDCSEVELRERVIIENDSRKDINQNDKDIAIYNCWKLGKEKGDYKTVRDMAKRIGKTETNLGTILNSSELKEKEKYKHNPTIQCATSYDIDKVKQVENMPDVMEKLLKLNQQIKPKISSMDLRSISKIVKTAGLQENVVLNLIDIVTSEGKIEPKKFEDLVNIIKDSPDDIREKVVKKEISFEDAKIVSKFETREQREKIIPELELKRKKVEKGVKAMENMEIDHFINARLIQAHDIKQGKNTAITTEFDRNDKEDAKTKRLAEIPSEFASLMKDTAKKYRKLKNIENIKDKDYCMYCVKNIRDMSNKALLENGIGDTITICADN